MKFQILLIMILLPLVASKTSNWYKWKKKRDNFTEQEVYDAYRSQFINDGTNLVRRELCYGAYYHGFSLTIRTKNPDSDAESMDCGKLTGGWTHITIYKPSIGSHGDYKRVIGGEKQKTEGGGYSGMHAMAKTKVGGVFRADVAKVKNNCPKYIKHGDDWNKIYESIRNDYADFTLNKFLTRTRNKLMFDKYTSVGDHDDSNDSDDDDYVPRRRRHHNSSAASCGVLFLWAMFIILFF
jgi:hypothetical protein